LLDGGVEVRAGLRELAGVGGDEGDGGHARAGAGPRK
jgi:hypothetical protein